MPLVYLNGGTPNFLGFEFSTAAALIDQIETTLVSAGWTSLSKVSGTSLFIRGVAETGSAHNTWLEFTVTGSAPNLTLNLQGWLEAAKTNGSGTSGYDIATFTTGSTNRLWLTANSGSLALCMFNSSGNCVGLHFGFCDRIVSTDEFAIYIGEISCGAMKSLRVAKLAHTPANLWFLVGNGFSGGTSVESSTTAIVPMLNFDLLVRFSDSEAMPASFNSTLVTNSTTSEAASHGHRNFITGLPLLDRYGYIEGENSTSYSASILNADNYERVEDTISFRGFIPHCVTGLSGERAAFQFLASDGSRYLSVGPGWKWQGMIIKGPN